jgi:hypothetical protein
MHTKPQAADNGKLSWIVFLTEWQIERSVGGNESTQTCNESK